MKKVGRRVDLLNINVDEIENWLHKSNQSGIVLKCQSIMALHRGAPMKEVCNVLGVTREAVRLWKGQLRKGGLRELMKKGKVGKRSRLNNLRLKELKVIIKDSPEKHGLEGIRWTGKLVRQYVQAKWDVVIGIRTAHTWLNKTK